MKTNNTIKKLSCVVFILTWSLSGFSQTTDCANYLDTAEIIEITKEEIPGLNTEKYYRENQYFIYKMYFIEQNCEWKVLVTKQKQTRKGSCEWSGRDCHQRPYCTSKTTVFLTIDANTKIIEDKEVKELKTHNLRVE